MRVMRRLMVKFQRELKMMKEKAVNRIRIKRSRRTEGTIGCPGRSAVKRNMAFQPHTQECNSRFENILKEEAK
eukprot:4616710-Karenia_brevis.AAC.1